MEEKENATLVEEKDELGPMPSYSTIRRFMKENGLLKQKVPGGRQRPGQIQAQKRFEGREIRSYEVEHVGALWHLDFHHASRSVLTLDGRWVKPILLAVLDDFLAVLPPAVRAAFEFRHVSWHNAEVFERLRARRLALCVADSERLTTPVEMTADYGYFRLRDEGYKEADIARWGETIADKAAGLKQTFVYFKHEKEGKGAEFAQILIRSLGQASPS